MIRLNSQAGRLFLCIACIPVLAGSPAQTQQQESAPAQTQPAEPALLDVMESLKGHLKFIAQHLSDPADRDQVLEHVHDMQRLVWTAKTMMPARIAALPEAERHGRQLDFRRRLDEVMIECCRLEMHVIDGHAAEAWNVIKGPLLKLREQGHELYQEEDDG